MHPHDKVEVLGCHVPHRPITHDAGIVDQDVQPAQTFHGTGDHGRGLRLVTDVPVVGDRCAAPTLDDCDYSIGIPTAALAMHGRPEIVDHHRRTMVGELQRMAPADAMPRPRDQCDLALE